MYITMEDQAEDQMAVTSQLYPELYTQAEPQQQKGCGGIGGGDEAKQRRRRKKVKKLSSDDEAGGNGGRKRKLSDEQVKMLEMNFGCDHKLVSEKKDRLASELGLDPRQVAIWFQNRRARWKNKKLEDEYSRLKAEHEAAVLDKCRLQDEIMKMKEQLDEAQKEIQKLSTERIDNISSNSPTSSLTMDVMNPQLLAKEFGLEGFGDMFCSPEINSFFPSMEWVNYS